jgi:tetrapyrrole methylase family protein/MazG family protein
VITVVGLGPAGPEHLTARTLDVIDEADAVRLRTFRHPSAAAVQERRRDATSFDQVYDDGRRIEEVYDAIVERLLADPAARAGGGAGLLCYAVPGSPSVAERTVELLRERAPRVGVTIHVEPSVSYLDLVWDRAGIDPIADGVRLADAGDFATRTTASSGPVLLAQAWSRQILSDVKLALEDPRPDQRAVILHHLGLPDEEVREVPWSELDRTLEPDHLTSVLIPAVEIAPAEAVARLAATVATLRQRCPWDREQTHRSLVRHLLEESYETIEALEGLGDDPEHASAEAVAHAEEELGDLLCQVVFHTTLGAEEGLFTLSDVARNIDEKLTARHPHVFASAHAETADDVIRNWERSKDAAKQRTHLLEGIPAATPALAKAEKVERKLRSVGLGWERSGESGTELEGRLRMLLATTRSASDDVTEAAGDLLMLFARWCADRRIDPEAAVRHALDRLAARVRALETEARAAGHGLAEWVADQGPTEPVHERQLPLC